jgi:hypothetical protein
MAAVLGIEASTASWGAACLYIVVNKVGAFIPVHRILLLSCMGHLTATTVRVGVFVSGVMDSLPFLSASPNTPPWEGEPADPDAGGGPKR